MGQRYTPIERVGICVPRAPKAFPSTILMNVIPARIAGVREIVVVTPPDKNGHISAEALAAARIAGADRIFKIGGAQAVAALAYGTESVPRVDKIVGPGGIFVATAKRKVFGLVAIDMIAGPSEILVLADGGCNPSWVAADLLSQAEHDVLASAVLVTDSRRLAEAVQKELESQLSTLPRQDIARQSIQTNGRIIVTDSLEKAVDAANLIAPEHLELCVEDPFALLPRVKNAGSIFLGRCTPEALGDYFAGDRPERDGVPSVRWCAEQLHLSANYFGDLVKKETGKSAQEYIQLKVIDIAKERIFDPGRSISEIAYSLGFRYPQHFTRLFKKVVGCSPNEYRTAN